MPRAGRIPWIRIFVEGAVIVGSILLAFGIDAWWGGLAEDRAEHALLERVRSEFQDNRRLIDETTTSHVEAEKATLTLLELAEVGEPLPMTPGVDSMVALAFLNSRTFNPGIGAVDAFLNSGSSLLIRNQELADLLVAWSGVVDELVEEESELPLFKNASTAPMPGLGAAGL